MTNSERLAKLVSGAHDILDAINNEDLDNPHECTLDKSLAIIKDDPTLDSSDHLRDQMFLNVFDYLGTQLGHEYIEAQARVKLYDELQARRN